MSQYLLSVPLADFPNLYCTYNTWHEILGALTLNIEELVEKNVLSNSKASKIHIQSQLQEHLGQPIKHMFNFFMLNQCIHNSWSHL